MVGMKSKYLTVYLNTKGFAQRQCGFTHCIAAVCYVSQGCPSVTLKHATSQNTKLLAFLDSWTRLAYKQFSELKKAYDTTWKYRIMKELYDVDLRGRLPLFIQNFYL